MSENITYVPSRLTSANPNKVIAGANEILDDDFNLKQNVINTLGEKVITLSSAPTSNTLTYTVNGVSCNFAIGDEVRVADSQDGAETSNYVYYKLFDISNGTAHWYKIRTSTTDTKNTTGSTNKNSTKMYLVGATNQNDNPVTYSNSKCYIGTDNCLYSNETKVLIATDFTNNNKQTSFDKIMVADASNGFGYTNPSNLASVMGVRAYINSDEKSNAYCYTITPSSTTFSFILFGGSSVGNTFIAVNRLNPYTPAMRKSGVGVIKYNATTNQVKINYHTAGGSTVRIPFIILCSCPVTIAGTDDESWTGFTDLTTSEF